MTKIIDNILEKYKYYSFFNELNIFIIPLEYYYHPKGVNIHITLLNLFQIQKITN